MATQALLLMLDVAAGLEGVRRVVGRTEESNVASQRVMLAAGMRLVGRDPEFLHFEIDLAGRPGPLSASNLNDVDDLLPGEGRTTPSPPGCHSERDHQRR